MKCPINLFCSAGLATALLTVLPRSAAADEVAEFLEKKSAAESPIESLIGDLGEKPVRDLELLRCSHLSDVWRWPGVRPSYPAESEKTNVYPWITVTLDRLCEYANVAQGNAYPLRQFAQPTSAAPVTTYLNVPEDSVYRVWLSQVMEPGRTNPVKLRCSGANETDHLFGALALPKEPGVSVERKFPVKFESEAARATPFYDPALVWEYWDVPLHKGATAVALEPHSTQARLDSLFITQSRGFVPAKAMEKEDNTLTGNHFRYRVVESDPSVKTVKIRSFINYQWIHHQHDFAGNLYYGSIGPIMAESGADRIPVGEWSRWVNGTRAATSAGDYAGDGLTVETGDGRAASNGFVEVQYAWYPHTGAVLRTLRCPLAEGLTRYTLPAQYRTYRSLIADPGNATGVWGMRDTNFMARFESEPDILARIFKYIDDAGLKDAALPQRIKLRTSCRISPALYDLAVPRLMKLGVNWLDDVPLETIRKYGLTEDIFTYDQAPLVNAHTHDPLDPAFESVMAETLGNSPLAKDRKARQRVRYFGMGDEIGPVAAREFVNGLPDVRRVFHDYLRGELRRLGKDAGFFGVKNVTDLEYAPELPDHAGVFQRRLYYHSAVFAWQLTSRFYERFTRAVNRVFPQARTMCNYTPGSFMHAGAMMSSDWFALPRGGGATLAWGEDWLGGTNYYAMAGIETVSYYAAVVECAARARNLPKGFYLVCRTGSIDRKLLALAARGVTVITLYDWGPEYTRGAVDTFSHLPWTYKEIGVGARALGPADEIVAAGRREPARVALLYNRVNEYWRGAYGGMHFERLLEYLALTHAHVAVDLILDEDLTPEGLKPYRVVYLNGLNMTRGGIRALTDWVQAGGTLVAIAGTALYDEYNDPLEEATTLFGARQRIAGLSAGLSFHPVDITGHVPRDRLYVRKTDLTPAINVPVVGIQALLIPTTGTAIGTYTNGACGAVLHSFGQGQTLLWGVMPGHIYRQNAPRDAAGYPTTYTAERRALIALPALSALGRPPLEYSEPLVEATLFEHESGLAVLLDDFSYQPGREAVLSVRTERPVKEVISALRGPLKWQREGNRIVVQCPVPDPVDSVILR